MASVSRMEPMLPDDDRRDLDDLATEFVAKSNALAGGLRPVMRAGIGDLVRAMNCYYSNLIEGHNTLPVDIDRALAGNFSKDKKRRDLQLEARAHIEVQRMIDRGEPSSPVVSLDFILWVHKEFCRRLPNDLLVVENPDTGEKLPVVPGELRSRDVRVGPHIPPDPSELPAFLKRFTEAYNGSHLSRLRKVIGVAASHHRLLWIHPFLDGNGRVARLVSHASLLETLDTGGIWSVARGLARDVTTYKDHLANCDLPRRNDLDGRGNLSEEALAAFSRFFLEICLDQVSFMENLVRPDRLRARILLWVEEEIRLGNLPPKSGNVLEAVLYRGELPRGDAAAIVGTGDRQARRIVSTLLERHVLTSDSARSPLRLAFPAVLASRWMPGLFPEKAD